MSHWNYLKPVVAPKWGSYGRSEGEPGTYECRYLSREGKIETTTVDGWDAEGAEKSLAEEGIHPCLNCGRYCEPLATELEKSGPSHFCGVCVVTNPRRFVTADNPVNWASRAAFDSAHRVVEREDRITAVLS